MPVLMQSFSGQTVIINGSDTRLGAATVILAVRTISKGKEAKKPDVVLENAGVLTEKFAMVEGNESSIIVIIISTFLLALMILPKLQESATKFNITPCLSITGSDIHNYTYPARES
ncbi:hypothetical protein MMC13_004529 [Lambiella insularis]|nr:hypothetical protein [Lambiella insularis]